MDVRPQVLGVDLGAVQRDPRRRHRQVHRGYVARDMSPPVRPFAAWISASRRPSATACSALAHSGSTTPSDSMWTFSTRMSSSSWPSRGPAPVGGNEKRRRAAGRPLDAQPPGPPTRLSRRAVPRADDGPGPPGVAKSKTTDAGQGEAGRRLQRVARGQRGQRVEAQIADLPVGGHVPGARAAQRRGEVRAHQSQQGPSSCSAPVSAASRCRSPPGSSTASRAARRTVPDDRPRSSAALAVSGATVRERGSRAARR